MEELRAALREKTPAKRRFNRGQAKVLVVLGVVILGLFGALIAFYVRQERAPTAVAAAPAGDGRLELGVAHDMARTWAVGWQADAQLVGAGTRWQLTGGDGLTPYRPSWSFSFHSPAAGQVQILTVDQAGVHPVRQVAVGKAPAPVEADWSLDSDELLSTFMTHGGEAFLRGHAHANLHFRLSGRDAAGPADRGDSVWYLSAIDPEARRSFVVRVDARSRQVVLAE
jgi:hypothetical protein